MRAIIDATVLNAHRYYKTYLREPSPASDFTIDPKELSEVKGITLEAVLAQMKSVGAGGQVMIAIHSDPKGFKMPLVKGGGASLLFGVMPIIIEICQGIRAHKALAAQNADQLPRAWQAWFRKYDPNVKLEDGYDKANKNWKIYVEKKFDEWFTRQGKTVLKFQKPKEDLQRFVDLLEEVRKLKLKCIEFRACRIGTDTNAMKNVAEFFNAERVVGPKEVRTFYGVITPKVNAKVYAQKAKAAKSRFPNVEIFMVIREKFFDAIAANQKQFGEFIKQYIHPNYVGGVAPFVIGGLEPSGTTKIPGKAHVFPLEKEYKELLTMYPQP